MVAANSQAIPPDASERDYLSPLEVVAKSGLSLATVRRYIRDGRLPSVQPGGPGCRVLIPASALDRFTSVKQSARTADAAGPPITANRPYSSNKPLPGPKAKWRRNH